MSAKAVFAAILGALALSGAGAQRATTINPLQPRASTATPENPTAPVYAPQPGAAGAPQLTPQDVGAWLDGFMSYGIGKGNIPGAVVVVVKDGQILAERGYGYANVEKKLKVDPKRTLFRPGSISKLFTWTAMMQQVQQGKIDLNADVNRYLDFKIPPYQGKPIRVIDLMTHSAGFEEQVKGILTNRQQDYVTFDRILKRWVPERIFAPGTTPAYSNYGASLAGYIVQRVSGVPFDDYVERQIFVPIGMTHSTFRQPLPANLRPLMSEGYTSGKEKPYGYEYVGPSPAGSLATTAEDMGKFMIAHLQNGGPILNPQTAQLMHSRVRQPVPGLNGMALGFYESNINGQRVIAHAGDTFVFHSDMHLFLDQNTGIFISFNGSGRQGAAGSLRKAFFENFADRYFPAPADTRQISAAEGRANAEKIAGLWSSARGSRSSFVSILDLLGQVEVTVGEKGELIIPGAEDLGGRLRKWVAVGPMLWREAGGHELIGAKLENGRPVLLGFNSSAAAVTYVPVPFHRASSWLLPLFYLSFAVLLLTALLWPTRALVRRRFAATLPLEGRRLQAYRASRVMSVAILLVLAGWFWATTFLSADYSNLSSGFDGILLTLQLLSAIVFVGGAAIMAWYAYAAWGGSSRWTAKLWSILLVVSALTMLYIGIVFHLIGWTTNY